MACFAVTLGVIILSGFNKLSAAKDICDYYAAVGQSLTLDQRGLASTDELKWTHNNTIIFHIQQGKVSVGKPDDISATGSLLLKNLNFSSAGIYKAHVLRSNGIMIDTLTHICMMDKVSKPQISYVCDFKSGAVNLNCHVAKPQGLVFSWTLDESTLTSETHQTLSISLTHLKGERSFTCSAANKVSKEKSDRVRPSCKSPSPPPLLCFTSKIVIAVLAGGSSLILLLLIIIMILCCKKTKMRLRDKGELRMISLNKQEPDSISPDYETMHPTEESSTPPSPKPTPRACYPNVSQPEVQTEKSLSQLSTAAEDPQPSPVPKPRTKGPQTPNV
ncbi:hypothetical protein PAMP_019988 [Pampus punctatissimus]